MSGPCHTYIALPALKVVLCIAVRRNVGNAKFRLCYTILGNNDHSSSRHAIIIILAIDTTIHLHIHISK